jgi:hypothetical protein
MDVPYRPVTNDLKLILFTKDLKRRNLHRKKRLSAQSHAGYHFNLPKKSYQENACTT